MRAFLFAVLALVCVEAKASVESCKEYLELAQKYPKFVFPQGSFEKGEIEILLDEEKMLELEKSTGRTLGVIAKDRYFLWVNDACKFPNGTEGVYGRILWARELSSDSAVIVMPILPDGKIALNCNFRHATRSWEVELPAGLIEDGEDARDAAIREAKEETGLVVDELILLGKMPTDTGVLTGAFPVFLAKVIREEASTPEDSEAIEKILALSVSELKEAYAKGYLEVNIRGEISKVPCRNSILAYALLVAEAKKLL